MCQGRSNSGHRTLVKIFAGVFLIFLLVFARVIEFVHTLFDSVCVWTTNNMPIWMTTQLFALPSWIIIIVEILKLWFQQAGNAHLNVLSLILQGLCCAVKSKFYHRGACLQIIGSCCLENINIRTEHKTFLVQDWQSLTLPTLQCLENLFIKEGCY